MNTTTTPTAEEMTVSPSFTEKQPCNLGPAELHLLSEGLPGWKTDTAEAATPTLLGHELCGMLKPYLRERTLLRPEVKGPCPLLSELLHKLLLV